MAAEGRMENGRMRARWLWKILAPAAAGGMLAAWSAAWVLGVLYLRQAGYLNLGVPVPDGFQVPVSTALKSLWDLLGVTLPTQPLVLALLLLGGGLLAGALLGAASWAASADHDSIGRGSLFLALRGIVQPSTLVFFAVELFAVALADWLANLYVLMAVYGLIFIVVVLMPVLICRTDLASRPRPTGWWRAQWPGWGRMRLFLIVLAAGLVVGWLTEIVPGTWLFPLALLETGCFLAPLLQGLALMADPPFGVRSFKPALTWRCLGPWVTYHGWLCAAGALLLAPVGVILFWSWRVLPVVAFIAQQKGIALPGYASVVLEGFRFIGRNAWMLMLLPLSFIYWLGAARVIYRVTIGADRVAAAPGCEA
ncbi:MAG: hypothetical protein P8018_11170 [Acidobacteriota bacterium]